MVETDWKVEDRADVIAADAIPPDVTLFWDSVSDNLIAVFKAGSSNGAPGGGAIDANGGLVRQIIHGSLQYDDPIEVAVADPAVITTNSGAVIPSVARKVGGRAARQSTVTSTNAITHLYPIYDAAAGSLQAIINAAGEIVSRNFAEGAYGEDEYALGGAAVDRVAVHATKDDQGNVTSVEVILRTTETLKSSTLASGLRLAAVTGDGEVVRSARAVPTLFDNNDATAVWKLTPAEWNALVDPAPGTVGTATLTPAALSIAATSELRAESWGDVPVLPAPDWALQSKPLFTSAAQPFELRELLANLSSWLSAIPAKSDRTEALYEVDDLSALGKARTFGGSGRESAGDPAQLLLGAAFHAQPFSEPLTGKNYVRARWYDPATGTWLSPDPLGYRDSSNLYAFCAGDPVNQRDPIGEGILDDMSAAYHRAADAIDDVVAQVEEGTDDSQWYTRSAGQALGLVSSFLRQGEQSGTELAEGKSVSQVIQNRVYEGMPLEEARALIQDWDQLNESERSRLIAIGLSKAASTIAGAKGLQELGRAGFNRITRTPPPTARLRVNLVGSKATPKTPTVKLKTAGRIPSIEDRSPLFRPGVHAKGSIPARSSAQTFAPGERAALDALGDRNGCHTCGAPSPGTKSGHWVPDHQPVTRLNSLKARQRLYPQCLSCSRDQGLAVARSLRKATE